MAREGMDVGQVTSDGTALKTIGDQGLPQVINTVNGIVHNLQAEWWGPDATAFVNDWEGTSKPNLSHIASEVSEFGRHAVAEAQQQAQASQAG